MSVHSLKAPFRAPFKTPFKANAVVPAKNGEKTSSFSTPRTCKKQTCIPAKRNKGYKKYNGEDEDDESSENESEYNSGEESEGDSASDSDGKHPRKKTKLNVKRTPFAEVSSRNHNSSARNNNSSPSVLRNPKIALKSQFKPPTFINKPSNNQSNNNANSNLDEDLSRRLTLGMRRKVFVGTKALHDPNNEKSLVLYYPSDNEGEKKEPIVPIKKKERTLAEILGVVIPKSDKKVHVVVDPILTSKLRPHQVEGVKFLYNCTTGKVVEGAYGCIMADEMGLGKTLQCIALLWTLLRQSSLPNKGTIEKAIIACPSSLVRNWANELTKWLGNRIKPLAIDHKGTKEKFLKDLRQFVNAQGRMIMNPVLIISYETLRTNISELNNCQIGLLLCDEGHRLKNSESLVFRTLNSLKVQRRVILSGTPIQNDLSEYFSLLNFANPGLLGTESEFRRNYENPILRGRDADASDRERETSDQKLAELWSFKLTGFDVVPVKYEHVVFCRLSKFQLSLYNLFLTSPAIQRLLRGVGSQPLKAITILKKLCNHPDLLDLPDDLCGSEDCFPPDYSLKEKSRYVRPEFSGKMQVLDRMLAKIKQETDDKIVLISNYTQTLDLFEKLCRNKKYGFLRLDGSMNIQKRQKLVDRFNNPSGPEFIFLLSSKAGGCGINLIGANRLILFDPDWNPAADQQALARIWRDGQKKECFIYRFIATGSIEEKIFQRQSHKQSLSSCVVDEDEHVERHFSLESLKQLFQFNPNTICDTHDTFKCKKCEHGIQTVPSKVMNYGDSSSWDHFTGNDDLARINDIMLKEEANRGIVSYVFQYNSENGKK
ncbi:8031_t:CDS:10 [Ambispora gerdemannii]|uniref:8031_t:CDS:1 n=1 Tax=Ambispora gerdemannii TaxID=144530 RepID=A0A9N8YNN7_9GLOM|nr:8031_t:CDS:10 [Ambispora gerdemannii]